MVNRQIYPDPGLEEITQGVTASAGRPEYDFTLVESTMD